MKAKFTLHHIFMVMLIITCLIVQPVFAKSDIPMPGTVPDTQTNPLSIMSSYPVTPHSIVPEITEV